MSSANLKLIISVFNYSYYYIQHSSHYHLLPQPGMLHITSRAAWGWPTGLVHSFEILLYKENTQAQEQPSSFGDRYCLSFKSRKVLVTQVSVGRFKSKKRRPTFFPTKKPEKLLRTSYIRGPVSNGSSTKCHVLHSRNSTSQCHIYYKVYVQWALQKICPQGTQPTRMQAHQAMQATACPLHPRERQGPRRSRKATKPPNQDFAWEGHHAQLSGVA